MSRSQESSNKKIKNACPSEYKGIKFKSQLEKNTYIALKEAGFPVKYEPQKFILWEGFRPSVPFYNKSKVTRMLKQDMKKLLPVTYTPDFVFPYKGKMIVIEAKGMEDAVFPLKRKMFRGWLEQNYPDSVYFEVFSKRHVEQAIEIIKNL